jgi:ABC-type oligopeptide transport system substrate-binding subunit
MGSAFEGISRLDKNGKPQNALATKIEKSSDGMTWTITLRDDDKWSNGDKVTAKDFVFSWQRTNDPKTASQYAYLFSGVKNADAIQAGKAKVDTRGIKAEGDNKLVITLEKPMPQLDLLLAFPVFFPQNENAVNKYGKAYGTKSDAQVFNGPYKVTGWTGSNNTYSLKKNSYYWNKKSVKTDTVNIQTVTDENTSYGLFQQGKVDYVTLTAEQTKNAKNNPNYRVIPQASTFYMEFNRKKIPAFNNLKIRQAFSLAIDQKTLVNNVLTGSSKTTSGFTSAGLAKNPKTGEDFAKEANTGDIKFDPTNAKKLLAEGMKEEGITSLNLVLTADDTPVGQKTTEFLQGQFEKYLPGVKVTNKNVPFKQRLNLSQTGQFDLVVTAWGADFADPISFLDLMTSDNSFNNGKFANKEYDALIAKANGDDATKADARWSDMVKAEEIIQEQVAVAPLYQQQLSTLFRTNVKDVIAASVGVPFDWTHAYKK